MNILVFLLIFLSKFSVKPVIDPKVVQYVVGIMNEKNAQLERPAFATIIIMNLPELFLNTPNAAALKSSTSTKYLFLTSTSLDILEHLVFNEENHTYTLTCIAPNSPYTMKVTLTKKRAERMMRAIIEHELGHLYFENHCRPYAPKALVKAGLGLFVSAIGIYNKSGHEIDWPLWLIFGGAYYTYLNAVMLSNSSFINSSKWEQEADEFITNDSGTLQGGILFQELALKAQIYIYSYSNWLIRLHAWWKRMDCAEFVKTHRESAHAHFERSSSIGEAYHPLHETRIARFNERIEILKNTEGYIGAEIEPIAITIYRGTEVIEKFIV
jgi:hypothetical protein